MSSCGEKYYHIAVLVLVLSVPGVGADLLPGDAVALMAARLQESQRLHGPEAGSWEGEELFMGSLTTGVTCAYDWTLDIRYLLAAESAASYLLRAANSQGGLLGDEAYALVRMSQVYRNASGDPSGANDEWIKGLRDFYDNLRLDGSTQAYVRYFDAMEPSATVFFFAYHVVAAYYVEDPDKEIWRAALLTHLSRVDDTSTFPVTALGVATWALARINKLDDTPVVSSGSASPLWVGVLLRDLPRLLLQHQVPQGEPFAGSFYWRFDHGSGGSMGTVAGYTEDAVYGTLGLAAAGSLEANLADEKIVQAILSAQKALLKGINAEGQVCEHLSCQGEVRHLFAGEVLQALWSVQRYLTVRVQALDAKRVSSGEGQN